MALSPMMKFYFTVKEQYKDCIVFFRLGDFYEMFFEDAKIASLQLDLTLTGKDCGMEERAPMCGVPYHAVDSYIQKLVQNGFKVAICEQIGDASQSKGLVEREVVRVITPGTLIEENILDDKKNNYLACVGSDGKNYAIAWIDVSTGEFNVCQNEYMSFNEIEDKLNSICPSEIICNQKIYDITKDMSKMRLDRLPQFQHYSDWCFDFDNAENLLKKHFNLNTLDKFELSDKKLAIGVCGALINYINETQKRTLSHISGIKYSQNGSYMILDSNSRRNLELVSNTRDGSKKATLLWVLDKTKTNMGARLLRRWIEQPLCDSNIIIDRQDGVQELYDNVKITANLVDVLAKIKDIERLTAKIAYGNPGPRDLVAIKYSLATLPQLKQIIAQCKSRILSKAEQNLFLLEDIYDLLDKTIDDNSPLLIKDGGFIKSGYDKQLDEFRDIKTTSKQMLSRLEGLEKEKTGIKNLKIGYNRVFGHYIEVSKSNLDLVPFYYTRKQTLSTGERYITEELKKIEKRILGAADNAIAIEHKIFEMLKLELIKVIPQLLSISKSIAVCDALTSFAVVAKSNNYCRPTIDNNTDKINIVNGRHPVVELLVANNSFVPNDTLLDCCQNRTMIITGPNMAGKSTYMRQVALITLMAHLGSFVPAKSADISLTDRIFTRIGASDDLAYGQSTFMVEMVEVATILHNATIRSLLILDEIGRGTSTFDGLSIAQAVMEEVSQKLRCKTLFSTHYHELTQLEEVFEGIKNYKIIAAEKDKGIIFLHKIMTGGASKSFGIEVAKLAGLPQSVITRAKQISKLLEGKPLSIVKNNEQLLPLLDDSQKQNVDNDSYSQHIKHELLSLDINNITPIQAFEKLTQLVALAHEKE